MFCSDPGTYSSPSTTALTKEVGSATSFSRTGSERFGVKKDLKGQVAGPSEKATYVSEESSQS